MWGKLPGTYKTCHHSGWIIHGILSETDATAHHQKAYFMNQVFVSKTDFMEEIFNIMDFYCLDFPAICLFSINP